MLRKPLAILLILSWVVLSGLDLLEDLEFETNSRVHVGSSDKSSPPYSGHQVSLVNNIVESAQSETLSQLSLFELIPSHASGDSLSSFHKVSELYKLHRVFLI
jgi:hypothetical protein